ncbi:MAG TPA: tail fiber protein [Allosphingosinicella sp.]|jgi:microcystin-dependent protein
MADPFVAEIRIFPFNFPPKGWAFCQGQLMPISQNTALFALLGTVYGGDGKSTFALPDLQGNAPLGEGQGQGLSERFLGEMSGSETVTLLQSEIPVHSHGLMSDNEDEADLDQPGPDRTLARSKNGFAYNPATSPLGQLAFQALPPAGGGLPHNNMMPYLTLNFCIALQGVFPPRP